jgi:hypothetical protein
MFFIGARFLPIALEASLSAPKYKAIRLMLYAIELVGWFVNLPVDRS